jgi:hypothetical protein
MIVKTGHSDFQDRPLRVKPASTRPYEEAPAATQATTGAPRAVTALKGQTKRAETRHT